MNEAQKAVPHFFMCPISLELFKDPVTLCTGHTYDRSSIEKWFAAGNLTCPVTMQRLQDPTLVPNHTLRHLIDEWLQMGPELNPDYLVTIDALASLKQDLESNENNLQQKLLILEKIQALTEESPSTGSCFLQLGILPSLLELLFGKVDYKLSQLYFRFEEQALICIVRLLPLCEIECFNTLKQEPKLESLQVMFDHGTTLTKESLCQLIEAVSSSPETKELCSMLCEDRKLLRGLVHLLQLNHKTSEAAIKALTALCSFEPNKERLVREGVIEGLIMYICYSERHQKSSSPKALATIEILLGIESAREALKNDPNGISSLVKMVFIVSDHEGSESAVGSLMIICTDSLKAREEAISAGVLTQLLLLLQSQCNDRTKAKGRKLLKLLRSKWDEGPNHL